ncbi:hypothetical protein AA0Y32_09895 [Georgenia phoenicis]|uniref:hypothetical protein n=1 Tax=unclassified Georgenia TaxID=2626815 RepID=UPI0039AFCB3D
MLRVRIRGAGVPPVVLGSGDRLLVGRAPDAALTDDAEGQLRTTTLTLPRVAAHVSRVVGEVTVGDEVVRLRWHGSTTAQLSSLFDAPGGARRVALSHGMGALLDEGENQILLLRGREVDGGGFTDLVIVLDVEEVRAAAPPESASPAVDADGDATTKAPQLERFSREWYVALALAEPWLTGADDYPRPASNREIYERVLALRGHAWNLERPQRVDDAIRAVARLAFGPADDPFTATAGRVQNVRFAVGRRAAEVRLVTTEDLDLVLAAQASGDGLNPARLLQA